MSIINLRIFLSVQSTYAKHFLGALMGLDRVKKTATWNLIIGHGHPLTHTCTFRKLGIWFRGGLKVLSIKMDQAKSGLVRKLFITGRGAEILSKFRPPPILRDPFKVLVCLLVFWLTIWKPLGMAKMKIYCAFVKSGMRSVVVIGETVCTTVHLWLEKPQQTPLRPIAIAGKTVFAQFPNARSILRSFSYWKMKDDDKKVHPTIGSRIRIFSSPFSLCQS